MCLLVFPIPYYITHTALRYRHPIDPFLTIFAVYAMSRLARSLAGAGHGDYAIGGGGAVEPTSPAE
jgi:hypothetical protein